MSSWLQTALYALSIIGIVVSGSAVFARQRRSMYLYYSLFSVSLAFWLACQYFIGVTTDGVAAIWLGLGFIATEAIVASFLPFALSYPTGRHVPTWFIFFSCLPLAALGPLSFSDLLVQKVVLVSGSNIFTFGALYNLQSLVALVYLLIGLALLLNSYRHLPHGEREQISLLFAAFTPFLFASIVTGLFFPNSDNLQFMRPLTGLLMILIISYTMAKHRLFDIRRVVVRSLGYVASLTLLVLLYGLVVLTLVKTLFDVDLPLGAEVFFVVSTAALALVFSPFKRSFERVTSHIFYQDAYDSQELFDELNKLLVSSLDVQFLMKRSAAIIEQYLRPGYCVIGLSGGEAGHRMFGDTRQHFLPKDLAKIRALATRIRHSVIVADELDAHQAELRQLMRRNEIAVLVRLTQNVRKNEEGLGYIALSIKKSGNPYNSQDVRTLETAANELVIAIQNALHYEEIQQFNAVLQARVEEATRKLRRSNEKLRALDEAKDDFVSMASHQLRTPLTSVKGYISMVLEGDAGKINATQRKLLEQSFVSSQRMVYLIADLLNVSRLKTGKFIIETTPVNLAELVEQEIGQLTETAASRQLQLSYEKPASFPSLMLDETKIRQVIMNFVDNAIYYTPAGGHIQVQLRETATSVELRVVDDGIGVPRSEQPHLFTKFYRAGNARKARPDGTGLGLFMAKKVVVAQGGAIIFETEENKGSTFGFVFSKATSGVPTPPASAER
jgi:signal transduction histidine kinase